MKELISPKQVAKAIGVSESTVKRWCDRALIPTVRTAGGHRRVRAEDILAFVVSQGFDLEAPELLGLPTGCGKTPWSISRAREHFRGALLANNSHVARQLLIDLLLAKHSVTTICDDVIARSFHEIGDLWSCGELQVYQERRACEICLQLLHEISLRIPAPASDAPAAIGATIEGDLYTLPVTIAGLVLKSLDWKTTLLGSNLPFETLFQAIEDLRPKIFWLSVSHVANEPSFVTNLNRLFSIAKNFQCALVIGGRGFIEDLRDSTMYHCYATDFHALEMFARSLHPVASEPTPPRSKRVHSDQAIDSGIKKTD